MHQDQGLRELSSFDLMHYRLTGVPDRQYQAERDIFSGSRRMILIIKFTGIDFVMVQNMVKVILLQVVFELPRAKSRQLTTT